MPDPIFSWSPENPSYEQPEVMFLAQSDNDAFNWYIEEDEVSRLKSFKHIFSGVGFYNVVLIAEINGCYDTSNALIEFVDTYKWLEITSFTPNSDGLNDVYTPYLTGVSLVEYEIYNRWGQLVFKGSLDNLSWDGTYQGNIAQEGVYNVIFSVKDKKDKNYYYRTSLFLLK